MQNAESGYRDCELIVIHPLPFVDGTGNVPFDGCAGGGDASRAEVDPTAA